MTVSGHVYEVAGWSAGEVWVDGDRLVAHDLPVWRRASESGHGGRGEPHPPAPLGGASSPLGTLAGKPSRNCAELVPSLCRRFARHLTGKRSAYDDVELDDTWCTPFQAALLQALRGVPWGDVVSYGELAALAGRPRAARAAGAFCAGNRYALVVPCHRVVSADSIGGYGSSGVDTKRRLLRLEGVEL
jgi:methylated-DNA-[protein]-cysteine S-methyltransferase